MLAKFIKQSWLVMVAALVFGLLVSAIHGQLEGKIKENARLKFEREMQGLFGAGKTFETELDKGGQALYFTAKEKGGDIAGYAFEAEGGGFADKIVLLVAVDQSMENLLGIAILKTNETPGFGDKIKNPPFKDQFSNCPIQEKLVVVKTGERSKADREIVSISGATISSEAVTKIVNDAVIEMKRRIQKEE